MAVEWKVNNCKHKVSLNSKTNVITVVYFNAKDSETVGSGDSAVIHEGLYSGFVELDTSDLSSFIAYNDVTEANAIAWVKATLGSSKVTSIETYITDQITRSKTPTEVMGRPWGA